MTSTQPTTSLSDLALPPTVPPSDIVHYGNFVSSEEADSVLNLLDDISEHDQHDLPDNDEEQVAVGWQVEGYERRRRAQRYSGALLEKHFGDMMDRVVNSVAAQQQRQWQQEKTAQDVPVVRRPTQLVVEEHQPDSRRSIAAAKSSSDETGGNYSVTTFESARVCRCPTPSECSCYVARVVLGPLPTTMSLNRPAVRDVECWDLASPHSAARVDMVPGSLTVKGGEVLREWRSRVDAVQNDNSASGAGKGSGRSVVLTFRCIDEQDDDDIHNMTQESPTTYSTLEDMPPLSDLLTIVVTTSPIKSNPSTELLQKTLETFHHAGPEFAYQCRKVIVCDGCRVLDDDDDNNKAEEEKKDDQQQQQQQQKRKISRKHSNVKQALRNGIATKGQAERYEEFKAALRKVCEDANNAADDGNDTEPSPFRNAEVVELSTRHGYGFALRHALRECVHTPYVCVIQHDRTFMRTTPMKSVVHAMMNDPERIKYVGCSMRSNLMYRDIFLGKYGKVAHQDLAKLVLRPPELRLDPTQYGPAVPVESIQVYGPHVNNIDKLQKNLQALAVNYRKSNQNKTSLEGPEGNFETHAQLTLTPTLFWYDNTHIVETAHYRDFVFNEKYRMVARGGFVEDKLSPVITKNVERLGLKDGHAKFGCYLLDDHSGLFFTGHLDGGAFITTSERGQMLSNMSK